MRYGDDNFAALAAEGLDALERLGHYSPGTDEYEAILEEIKAINELIVQAEKVELEERKFLSEARSKNEELKAEKKGKWIDVGKEVLKGIAGAVGTFLAVKLCLGVEKEDIILRTKTSGEAVKKAINWKP